MKSTHQFDRYPPGLWTSKLLDFAAAASYRDCQQSAKSLELRASLSLARLWQYQGKMDLARQTLAGLLEAFTEGFETADWQQAKALLDALT